MLIELLRNLDPRYSIEFRNSEEGTHTWIILRCDNVKIMTASFLQDNCVGNPEEHACFDIKRLIGEVEYRIGKGAEK